MTRRRVVLLGATGSIGRQVCDIVSRYPDRLELVGAVAGSDVAALTGIADRLKPARCAVVHPPAGTTVPGGWAVGADAACEVAAMDADVVCVAITGAAALHPALAAVDAGRDIALATKEVLVMAGAIVCERVRRAGSRLIPVDSEHSALWQCLRGEEPASIDRIVLTASGGSFRDWALADLSQASIADALAHPTWTMGPKVTIDSATMMNKGLEIVEAHFLFDVPYSRIGVARHRSSLVHSFVEFVDGATMAQIGTPDMRVPIALALTGGERLPGVVPAAQLTTLPPLDFADVDRLRYPAVALARAAGEAGGIAPCILNAANEAAVAAFLQGGCRFIDIIPLVERCLGAAPHGDAASIDGLLDADAWARAWIREHVTAPTRAFGAPA